MHSTIFAATMLLSLAQAQGVINLIQPLWEERSGRLITNRSSEYAASIIEVNSAMTTYAVACNSAVPNGTDGRVCYPGYTQLFTQGSTSLHYTSSYSSEGTLETYSADYTYSSTLAPNVTSTYFLLQIQPATVFSSTTETQVAETSSSPYALTTQTLPPVTQSVFSHSYSDMKMGPATWYQIPITAGAEKLGAASATASSSSSAATGSPSSSAPTGSSSRSGAQSSSSSAAGAKFTAAAKFGVVGAVAGGLVGGFLL